MADGYIAHLVGVLQRAFPDISKQDAWALIWDADAKLWLNLSN